MEQQIRRSAKGSMQHHSVVDGCVGEYIRCSQVKLAETQNRARGTPGCIEPDGLPRWSERSVRQRKSNRLGDHLRGCGGAHELAASAGCSAGPATHLGGIFQRNLLLGESGADGLHLSCVLSVFG